MEQDCSINHLNKMSIRLDLSADRGRRRGFFLFPRPCGRSGSGRVTGMDVVGVRLVQSKQEQHVGHGAVHLHTHIPPLNDNIPPISVSTSSIAAPAVFNMSGPDRNLRSCPSKTQAPPPFTHCL